MTATKPRINDHSGPTSDSDGEAVTMKRYVVHKKPRLQPIHLITAVVAEMKVKQVSCRKSCQLAYCNTSNLLFVVNKR